MNSELGGIWFNQKWNYPGSHVDRRGPDVTKVWEMVGGRYVYFLYNAEAVFSPPLGTVIASRGGTGIYLGDRVSGGMRLDLHDGMEGRNRSRL